jgi:hypothetical protein
MLNSSVNCIGVINPLFANTQALESCIQYYDHDTCTLAYFSGQLVDRKFGMDQSGVPILDTAKTLIRATDLAASISLCVPNR